MRLLCPLGFRPRAGAKHVLVNLCNWQDYVVDTYRLPFGRGILHHKIIRRWLHTDMRYPRVPFRRNLRRIKIMLERSSCQTVMIVESGPSLLVQSPPNGDDLDRDVNNYMGSFKEMSYLEPLLLGSYSRSSDSRS